MSDYNPQGGPGPYPGPYPQGGPQMMPPAPPSNNMAIAALVCGIVGVVLAGIVLGPLAIIFGGLGLRNVSRGAGRRGFALAGLILGIIDVLIVILLVAVASTHGVTFR